MPEISIIIPVYNVEKYLRQCLDSLINQTFKDFEIICIDDGSTDGSLEILNEYAKRDGRFLILQPHHCGAGAQRNLGIKLAHGKYIQFLDSDDYFEPEMLEELYNKAESFGADIAVCSVNKVDEDGNLMNCDPKFPVDFNLVPSKMPFDINDIKENAFSVFNVAVWNKLYLRKLIVENHLEFQNLTTCNDTAFGHISKLCAHKIVVTDKKLVNYRTCRAGSISANRALCSENIIKVALCVKEFMINRNMYDDFKEDYIRVFKRHIQWETGQCTREQGQKFVENIKTLMPEDWQLFKSVFSQFMITPEYLTKFIGNRKVMLWGASNFIREVLEEEKTPNPNILGIVDKNPALQGTKCGYYIVYPPEKINEIKPDGVLMTVLSDNTAVYESLKKEFAEKYSNIELLPNIFEGEIDGI